MDKRTFGSKGRGWISLGYTGLGIEFTKGLKFSVLADKNTGVSILEDLDLKTVIISST